jgi:GNAT superfamily N-acetyltransferase
MTAVVAVTVRPAHSEEAAALAEIQRAASVAGLAHIFPPERYPFPIADVQERWRRSLADPAIHVLVADTAGDAVGAVGVRAGWLDGLYVHPEQWGFGIGRLLHDEALHVVRGLGRTSCRLWVLEENWRARRFYERLGWRENGTSRLVPYPPNPFDVGYTLDLRA